MNWWGRILKWKHLLSKQFKTFLGVYPKHFPCDYLIHFQQISATLSTLLCSIIIPVLLSVCAQFACPTHSVDWLLFHSPHCFISFACCHFGPFWRSFSVFVRPVVCVIWAWLMCPTWGEWEKGRRGPSSFGGFKIIDFLISFVWQKDFLRFGLLFFFFFLWFFPLAVCVKATDNVEINIICPIWGCLMSRPEICLAQIENQNQF